MRTVQTNTCNVLTHRPWRWTIEKKDFPILYISRPNSVDEIYEMLGHQRLNPIWSEKVLPVLKNRLANVERLVEYYDTPYICSGMTVYKDTNYLNIGGRNFNETLVSRVMLGNPAFITNITNGTKLHVSPLVVDFYATARIFDMQTHERKIASNTLVKKVYEIVPDHDRSFMRLTRNLNNYMFVLTESAFVGNGETSIHFAGPNDNQNVRSLYRYPRYYQYHNRIRVIGM